MELTDAIDTYTRGGRFIDVADQNVPEGTLQRLEMRTIPQIPD
jgi:hypothetical protein